jgi:SAM-dependent methyltransferase
MTSPDPAADFWESPELVERFASRDPDLRLLDLIERFDHPAATAVLDLGCAGGRNTVLLADRGFDIHAIDGSRAMVARTRARLTPLMGEEEATARVELGRMDDLSHFADGTFALVLGLGIYHQADSEREWDRAIAESARVLAPGGLLLYASFHPETAPEGEPGTPVPGEPGMYSGFRSGKIYLIGPEVLEARLAAHGLEPASPTKVARVRTEKGERVTVNALFRRARSP